VLMISHMKVVQLLLSNITDHSFFLASCFHYTCVIYGVIFLIEFFKWVLLHVIQLVYIL
jgi:hypothetical protein